MLAKKILASLMIGGALLAVSPMTYTIVPDTMSVAEAGTVKTAEGDWKVYIDDSSVYMVGSKHARLIFSAESLFKPGWTQQGTVDIMWGKGVNCKYVNTGKQVISDIALAIANYMDENY